MAFDAATIPPQLVDAVSSGRWVPLIGAGFSKQSSPEVYSWGELLGKLREKCLAEDYVTQEEAAELEALTAQGQFLLVAEHLRRKLSGDYEEVMKGIYLPAQPFVPSAAHEALFRLKPKLIMTTNYDRLLDDAVARAKGYAPRSYTYEQAAEVAKWVQGGEPGDVPVIFKLHGDVAVPESLVLTESDYRRLLFRETGYRLVLSAIFLTRTVLMLGFSADDPELRLLLASHREALDYQGTSDFSLLAVEAGSVKQERLREDFGVRVIPYTPDAADHPELLDFLEALAIQAFPEEAADRAPNRDDGQ